MAVEDHIIRQASEFERAARAASELSKMRKLRQQAAVTRDRDDAHLQLLDQQIAKLESRVKRSAAILKQAIIKAADEEP